MKTLIWTLAYPIVCAVYMVARAHAFRSYSEQEYIDANSFNCLIWFIGGCAFFVADVIRC